MTATLVSVALAALVLGLGGALLRVGSRAGDRFDEAAINAIGPDAASGGIRFTVTNRGPHPVLVGASLRRRSVRVRFEAGHFVSVPRLTWRRHLLAGRHAVVCAIAAGEIETVVVPVARDVPQRAELVVSVGESDRLRVVHRAVSCAGLRPSAPPEPAPLSVPQPS